MVGGTDDRTSISSALTPRNVRGSAGNGHERITNAQLGALRAAREQAPVPSVTLRGQMAEVAYGVMATVAHLGGQTAQVADVGFRTLEIQSAAAQEERKNQSAETRKEREIEAAETRKEREQARVAETQRLSILSKNNNDQLQLLKQMMSDQAESHKKDCELFQQTINDLQNEIRTLNERAELKAKQNKLEIKKDRIQDLRRQLAQWKATRDGSQDSSVRLQATANVTELEGWIQDLGNDLRVEEEREQQVEQEKNDREAKIAAEKADEDAKTLKIKELASRTSRIDLTKHTINQNLLSLTNTRRYHHALVFFASACAIASIASTYFAQNFTPLIGLGVVSLFLLGVRILTYEDVGPKEIWLGIFLEALKTLESNPEITARAAVRDRAGDYFTMNQSEQNNLQDTNTLVARIEDSRITGNLNEQTPTIPAELQPIVSFARSPTKAFKRPHAVE